MLSLTSLSFFTLSNLKVSADPVVDDVRITVQESCTLASPSDTGNTYNVTVSNGQYKNDIGKTRLSVFCNTKDSFVIYAIGYSNDTLGNNEMITTAAGINNIVTGTATSGDTSNWAMKLEAVTGTGTNGGHVNHTPTIISPFNNFAAVPTTWAKVAEVASATGATNGAAVDASYAIYIAPKQPAASYTGKVRYTVIHPSTLTPYSANLDTGSNINKKLKSLASGTNVTSESTSDTLITAFVRSHTLPDDFVPSEANTISVANSEEPVYVWFDNDTGIMSYYSRASKIWANKYSSNSFYYMESLTDISGLKDWKVDNVNYTNSMFSNTQISDLTPIANWKVDNVTDMDNIFRYCSQISDLTPIANWKVDNVTDMRDMFYITQISDLTPIANWKVDNVTNMGSMFAGTQISDLAPIANWKVDNVTNMSYMFDRTKISDLTPIANWKVDNVTNMGGMFNSTQISDLTPISNWKVDRVTNMGSVFARTKISDLTPIANWKVDNVTNMGGMFDSTQISDLTPISNWKVDNVTGMDFMFRDCKISDLTPIANWNVGKVTSMYRMFRDISTLTNAAPINRWNVNSVTSERFYEMFGGATPKTNLPIFTSRPGTWNSSGTYIPDN